MKKYIQSLRLRTLPLSAAGVILGNFLFIGYQNFSVVVFLLSLFTALSLQIVSNLANEMGDAQCGLDGDQHEGPMYALQQGLISFKELRYCMFVFIGITALLGVSLIYSAMGTLFSLPALLFLFAGLFAIVAALTYTLGKKPYGYRAFGDLSVFIFFGLLSVVGANYLQTLHFYPRVLLPASAIGLLSVAVLNLNNIRDLENDVACGKITVASKLGERNAKIYHILLIFVAVVCLVFFGSYEALFLLPLYVYHIISVFRSKGRALDKQFPLLSFSTLLLALLCAAVRFILFSL